MASNLTARSLMGSQQNEAAKLLYDSGLDAWSRKNATYKQDTDALSEYLNGGKLTAEDNERYRAQTNEMIQKLSTDMQQYGKSSNAYKALDSYKTYYQNALGMMRQDDLQRGADGIGSYLSSGKFTSADNTRYRQTAEQTIASIEEEMKSYKTDSDYYKMLDAYKKAYAESLGVLDRTDAAAAASDFAYDYSTWHTAEDFAAQKTALEDTVKSYDAEMAKIEDKDSEEYKLLESYKEMYSELLSAVESKGEFDSTFGSAEEFTSFTNRDDYEYAANLRRTKEELEAAIDPTIARLTPKQLDGRLQYIENQMFALQAYGAPESDIAKLQKEYDDLSAAKENLGRLDQLRKDEERLDVWQDWQIRQNYGGYDANTDYQQLVDDLKDQLQLAEKGTQEYEKISAQIRAIAGVNGDGTNANGLYDENSFLGRQVMERFDVDAAEEELGKLDEIISLYDKEARAREEVQRLQESVASEEMFSQEEQVAAAQKELDKLTAQRQALQAESPDYDLDEAALRSKRTDLNLMLQSSANRQERSRIEDIFANLTDEERAALIEEGKKHFDMRDNVYVGSNGRGRKMANVSDLDDEYGGDVRDALLAAIGAEYLGIDLGYDALAAYDAYEATINDYAGAKLAKKVSGMGWAAQVLGMGTQAGLNQFAQGIKQVFSKDQITPNKIASAGAYTRADLAKYGNEDIFGSNVSQLLYDTVQTTANMLPMIAASYLTSGALGAAGIGTTVLNSGKTVAQVAGQLTGAGLMGLSSGGNSYSQALAEGWKPEDARTFAIVMGAAEASMQYLIGGISGLGGVSEEGLLTAAKGINNAAVRIATETGIHIASETIEELAQNRVERYLTYTLTGKGDPNWVAWNDDDWYTVLVTALSTGAMEGPGAVYNTITDQATGRLLSGEKSLNEKQIKHLQSAKINKQNADLKLLANEVGEAMRGSEALAYTLPVVGESMPEDSTAHKLAVRMKDGKAAKNATNYGALFSAILSENKDLDKSMNAIIGGALKYNEIQGANSVLEEKSANLDRVKAENPGAQVLDATASRLTELGGDPVLAVKTSAVIDKILNGTAISAREMAEVAGDSNEAMAARAYLAEATGDTRFSPDMRTAYAEAAVTDLIAKQSEAKKQEAARTEEAVAAAASAAAAKVETDRATAGAEGPVRAKASDAKALQDARREVELAKQRKAMVEKMTFEQMAEASEDKLAPIFGEADAKILRGLAERATLLEKRIARLSEIKIPSREQRTELANYRNEMREIQAKVDAIRNPVLKKVNEAAKAKAKSEEAKAAPAQATNVIQPKAAAAAQSQARGDADTLVIRVGGQDVTRTRADFVKEKTSGEHPISVEEANQQFDDMVAMTTGRELAEEKGANANGREQAADRNEARNDLGEQRNRAEDSERGDRSEQGAVGGNEAPRTRALSTASGKKAAKVTEGAVETTGENAAGLESKYPGVEKLAKYLMNSGVKRVVYVTDGQILNAANKPVAGVYYDGEIFLNLNYKGGYHYSVTADHERMHARLALYKAALAERYGSDEAAEAKALAETREFVASALESILGEDTYADAFGKYWDSYAEPYLKAGAKPEDIMYMVCEEMLSDMAAGMNNLGARLGIYADEANDFLEVSKFDAAIKSIVAGENPIDLAYELPAENNMPFGLTFKELRPGDVRDAFKNEIDTDVPPEQRTPPGEEPMHPELSLLSQQSLTEGTGLKLRYNDLGYVDAVIDPKTGEKVTEVTPEMMANTPLGKLVQDAIIKTDDNGKIISGHITQEQADAEYKLLADAMNLITRYNDAPLVWEVVGSQLFSGVKKNSDTQYNYTIDFGTICRKTQAIVNVMSETMKYLKRGLSRREVEEVYLAVGKSGEATPCPVCYVFSRWMGIGGLLDQINRYQNEYFDINQNTGEFTWKVDKQQVLEFMRTQEDLAEQHVKDVLKDKQAAVDKARAELEALRQNADEETRKKAEEKLAKAEKSLENKRKDFLDENGNLKYGGILSDMKSNSAIDGAIQKINQLDQGDRLNEELLAKMDNATPEQQKKFLEIIKKNRQNKMAILKAYAPAERAAYDALAKEFNAINKKNKIKKDNFTAEQRVELDAAMLRATEAAKDGLDEALATARAENDPVEKYQWLAKTVLSLKPGLKGERIWEFNEDYKPVKQAILFDLNKGADFAKDYPLTWGFRTGKGCAMGKAIMPYSDARVGETLQGVVSSNGLRVLSDKMLEGKSEEEQKALRGQYGIMSGGLNPFLNGEELQRADVVTRARAWARKQNLIGGMRYQSTSDFRFEWGSDYLITFFELQAIGANVQLYTKVIEAVDFLASTHSDCNLSVMPLGDGYVQVGTRQVGVDKNGKPILEPIYELAYSGVTGIDKDAALEKVHQYDNVQLILVGINDLNIRLALASEDVTFVIPFHGSGQSVHQVQTLMDLLRENLDVNKARDYSDVQTDHFKKNRTAEEKAMWDLRMDIIMGNCLGGLNEKQQALIAKNKHLDKLYKMFYKQTENKAYHCFLAKEQASQIFPYEYWDTTTTYATADRNGQIFQDYCESMGIIPRFSGKKANGEPAIAIDENGNKVVYGDFTKDTGYWKLLIDRKMYANTYDEVTGKWTGYGNYRDQEKVTTDNIKIGMLDESTVAEGRGDWATASAIPERARTKPIRSEKTQAIMTEAIYGTEDPDDKIQVTGIENLKAAHLNEIDRTKMTKDFRKRYLDAKSELRNVPAVPEEIPVYALAMTDPGYKTSKREAPVTDGKQKLYVAPSSDAWAVARDVDGSLLNTDYIKNVLGLDIYDNPKDEHVVEERGSAEGGVGHLTAVTSTVPSYRQAFQYLKDKFPNAQNMRVLDASSGQGLGTAYGRNPAAAGKDAEKKLAEAKAKLTKFTDKTSGKILSKKEADTLKSLRNAVDKAEEVLAEIHKLAGPDFDNSDVSFNVTDLEPYNDPSHKVDFKKYGGLIAAIDAGEEEPFDFVISNAVMNVIAQDAREELMAALLRMTKPGGQIFINPADTGASDGALTLQQFHSAKEAGQDISGKKVLLVPKSENIGPETYVAKTKTIQKAFKPKEFQAFARDVAKQALGEDIEIVAGGTEGTGAINKGFIITRPKANQNEPPRFSIQLTSKQQKNLDDNNKQTETGSKLKTLQGSTIQRYQNNVGKPLDIGPGEKQVYVHKQYMSRVVPEEVLNNALEVLKTKYPNFQYNTIMYNTKTNDVRFDEAPNFDTAREPIPGGMITVSPNGDTKIDYSDNIWHHKWMWVDNDYEGFGKDGVRKSWEWSRQWLNSLRAVPVEEHKFESKASQRSMANGVTRGPSGWNEQLEYIGLPTDPASDVEIKDKKAEIARIKGETVKPVIPAKNAPKKQAASRSTYSIQEERPVDDVVTAGNGALAVEIDSKASGLNNFPKGQWGALLRDQIRRELVGKTIVTEDGDLISFRDRSAREPTFGIAAKEMLGAARESGDFSRINQKWLTLDHLASIVALSQFKSWSENTKPDDWFKRDGINHRTAVLYIDGVPYEADIATALNTNEEDVENYGDKFYDIKISEEPSAKTYGDPREGSSPYKIKYADDSSDKLSIAQKERAVKNAGLKFVSEKKSGNSAMANAFANAGKLKRSPQSAYSIQDDVNSLYPPDTLENDLLRLVGEGPEAVSDFINEALANHEDALEAAKIKAPPIPSKGFVPRVTRSGRTTLDRILQEQIEQFGSKKPSEKSNGFVIPEKRKAGENYRKFYQNVGSAKNLPSDAQDLTLRELLTSTESVYVPDSDKALIKGAKDEVSDLGYGPAMTVYKRDSKNLKMSTKGMLKTIALGEQLLIEAARQGDAANFIEVLASVSELGTTIGKSLQAFRLLKMSGPIGQLYYIDKAVKRINGMNEDRIKRGTANEIVAKPELCQAVIDAKTAEERDAAMNALKQDLADQCPKTLWDRWNAWRYLSMLGNVRTHVRNIIGNAVFVPLRYTKDLLAASGEFLATKAGWMEEEDRRKAILVSRELRDFALADADVMKNELQGNGKYNPAQEILSMRKLLPGFLDTLSRINSNGIEGSKLVVGLEGEDWTFLRPAYARALAMQLEHSSFSLKELQGSPEGQRALNEMRKVAIEEAQKATYRDFSAVASWLNRGKQLQGAGRIAAIGLEGVLPFTKTPINILKRGVEYSPIGIAKGLYTIFSGLKAGEMDVAEAIDQLAAGLTGTGVAALGWLLARMGWLRGKKNDDDEENFDKLQGYQDYSIQIGDQSFTIDWAAPTALPLFTGAAVAELMEDDHELSWGDAWNAMMLIAEPMTSLSMLDGLNKLIDSTSYASGSEKLAVIGTQAATSYLGQAFPTILGQVARTIDGTRRSTYIDKNSPVPAAMQRFVQSSVQSKIPGWESAKVPYIDAWGRQSEAGSMVLNGIENFFMPYYRSVKNTTDVDEAIQDLYRSTKADILPSVPQKYFSVNGERKDLTADEWVSYATDVGQTKYTLLAQLIYDPRYLALSDDQKAKAIKDYIYKYATTAGKFHVDPTYDIHGAGKWIEEAEAAATDYERFERIWQQIEKGLKD